MKFNLRGTPGPILAIMVALCLFAVSAALIGFLYLLVSLAGSDRGGWHGVPEWFVIVGMMSFFLSMLAGATIVISTLIAMAMFVNDKPARTPMNLIVTGLGALTACGSVAWVVSRVPPVP